MKVQLTEREELLIALFNGDFPRYYEEVESDEECEHIANLNELLNYIEICEIIEKYNKREHGVTYKECLIKKCLLCKDFNICDLEKRKEYEQLNDEGNY